MIASDLLVTVTQHLYGQADAIDDDTAVAESEADLTLLLEVGNVLRHAAHEVERLARGVAPVCVDCGEGPIAEDQFCRCAACAHYAGT